MPTTITSNYHEGKIKLNLQLSQFSNMESKLRLKDDVLKIIFVGFWIEDSLFADELKSRFWAI